MLDCAKCRWRIYLEAHHAYGSGRIDSKTYHEEIKQRGTNKVSCPKCKSDAFKYVRTDVSADKVEYLRKAYGLTDKQRSLLSQFRSTEIASNMYPEAEAARVALRFAREMASYHYGKLGGADPPRSVGG